jgi:MFS transporter, NNP family, nitrate/nitrite transporter
LKLGFLVVVVIWLWSFYLMFKSLFSFQGRYRILHLTWFAFFLTFTCWFNFAPFGSVIAKELNLDYATQIKTLLICNLALTIPARIIIGMLLDKFGPRVTFSSILGFALVPCMLTALAQDFNQLVIARLLMGLVGSGFVVGIRMVSEWFPPKEIGTAEGIYGGWGNFGAFGAEFALPAVAVGTAFLAGGQSNWRLAIALTGVVTALYGLVYFKLAEDTPSGKVYQSVKKVGGMEVTSPLSFAALMATTFGLVAALAVLAWRLMMVKFFDQTGMVVTWVVLAALYVFQFSQAWAVNKDMLQGKKQYAKEERYQFRQVALLELCYVTTFGSELAAVSMLPSFFEKTFSLEHGLASMIAASYPFLNLFSRPLGGVVSDALGSRKWTMTLVAAGTGVGYLSAYWINKDWALPAAVAVTMFSAFFAQAGCGATYGIVPLVKKEITGQVAGNVGAYGNFGGVMFLLVYSLGNAQMLFATMGVAALVCASCCAFFLREPQGSFAEHYVGELEVR